MATVLKEVDAVCIGVGFTGSILARELTKAGLRVVGLERGANRSAREDFTLPAVRDDLKYAVRQELFQDTQMETVTLRHSSSETALPLRRLGSFLPGTGVGGAGAHWNGVTWRLLPSDHDPARSWRSPSSPGEIFAAARPSSARAIRRAAPVECRRQCSPTGSQ